jgi:hypothetical protein
MEIGLYFPCFIFEGMLNVLDADTIEVEPKSIGLNPKDVLIASKSILTPLLCGLVYHWRTHI